MISALQLDCSWPRDAAATNDRACSGLDSCCKSRIRKRESQDPQTYSPMSRGRPISYSSEGSKFTRPSNLLKSAMYQDFVSSPHECQDGVCWNCHRE